MYYGKEQATLSAQRIEKVRQAKKSIDEHIGALAKEMRQGKSEALTRFLDYVSQFHRYSLGNLILAVLQRPHITRLAGLRQWNKLGRTVKPGEKGIMILAPVTVKKQELEREAQRSAAKRSRTGAGLSDDDGEAVGASPTHGAKVDRRNSRPEEVTFFKPVYVFDIAQTEGAEPPTVISAAGNASVLWPALQRTVEHAAIRLEFVEEIHHNPSVLGVSLGGRILLRSDLAEADAFRTLAHEYAHEILEHRASDLDRRARETEADATAYVVCRHFGLTCDSSDYLQLYDVKPELVYARLETIRQAADCIIYGVETTLEMVKARH